jgi:hypothetical protein
LYLINKRKKKIIKFITAIFYPAKYLTPPPTPSSYEDGTFKKFVKSLALVGVVEN